MENHSKTYFLLIACTLIWAMAWPISKIGLQNMSPIWYAASRSLVGAVCMFSILIATKKLKLPTKQDIPILLSVGLFQACLFIVLINVGLRYVDPGRSVILVYSTPLWVTPIAVLFFNETLNKTKWAGLALGVIGILIMFNPWHFDWSNHAAIFGNAALICASFTWAGVMVHTRYGSWESDPITLIPWQLAIATVPCFLFAMFLEPHGHVHWCPSLILTILYNGIFATAIGFFAAITVTSRLPIITTSLGFLLTPVFGLLFSSLLVEEHITFSLIAALSCIIAGLAIVTLGSATNRSPVAQKA